MVKTKAKNMKAAEYFENLPARVREMVKDLVKTAYDSAHTDVYYDNSAPFTDIECHSRDGFIAFDSNRGGIMLRGFTDIHSIEGSGTFPAHKGARQEIERQLENDRKNLVETLWEEYAALMEAHGLDEADICYNDLEERGQTNEEFKAMFERYQELEESQRDGESTVMFEARFMYHGTDENGVHKASVSAAVNTEGPYHRSSIPWAPGVFCEGAKEIEITWKTEAALKTKLARAIKKAVDETF